MDVDKAKQALTDGDWHGLALALADGPTAACARDDADTMPRMTITTIGALQVVIIDQEVGDMRPDIAVHAHTSAEDAADCARWKVDMVQQQRAMAIDRGVVVTLHVDGVLVPAPEPAPVRDPIGSLLARLGFTAPDDPGDLGIMVT